VGAVVVLDSMALFNAHKSTEESAAKAAVEARNVYSQTQDVGSAERAAEKYLSKSEKTFRGLETSRNLEGTLVFEVSAKGQADTYGFKYLQYVGLKDWVNKAIHPTATGSSS
jgi:hypothetical protein